MGRRSLTAAVALVSGLLASVASAGGTGSPALVLGGPRHTLLNGIGWGTAHPPVIYNGGDPSGRAFDLKWRDWGSPVAEAHGLTWLFMPRGGYYRKPGAIELRAFRIRRCATTGPRAYTRLQVRVADRPGGPIVGTWGPWASGGICF